MRLGIDMQACLTDSRYRGIGRYADNLVEALLQLRGDDDTLLALDATDIQRLREARTTWRRRELPAPAVVCDYPTLDFIDQDPLHVNAAARVRGRFYESLGLDVFLHTSFFETGSNFTTSIDWLPGSKPGKAVIAYDIIPLLYPERYLQPGHFISTWYPMKVEAFKAHDCFLAISEATRRDLIEHLGIAPERVHTIGAGLDPAMLALARQDVDVATVLSSLGLAEPFVLMVGNGDWRKNTLGTLQAYAALPESLRRRYRLVLTQVGEDVKQALAGPMSHLADRVSVLGRVNDTELAALYRGCRVFFFPSLYEGFGLPVLEAMAFGAPVIASNQGSLPEVVHTPASLFDVADTAQTVAMLAAALEDDGFRSTLLTGAQAHAWNFTWQPCAEKAWAALRALAAPTVASPPIDAAGQAGRQTTGEWSRNEAPANQIMTTRQDIAAWAELVGLSPDAAAPLERGLLAAAAGRRRRVLVDISEVVRLDARSGIQRVVRNYCAGLHRIGSQWSVDILPVCWTGDGMVHANIYARDRLGLDIDVAMDGQPVVPQPNDLAYMLDSSWWMPERFDSFHAQIQALGGEVVWMVYDLIPLSVPESCDPVVPPAYSTWLNQAVVTADGFTCISEATRLELEQFMDAVLAKDALRPWTRAMHLGSDLESGRLVGQASTATQEVLAHLDGVPMIMAIGTVEPRKDYATILSAFERVWARGVDAALVIIGKEGWNVDELVARLRSHPQAGKRLFWLEGLSDEDLQAFVQRADALVQASIAEGFGLPIVEAGSQGKPLLLSDIAVFHEIAGHQARYFPVGDPDALAMEIVRGVVGEGWLYPLTIKTMTWSESAEGLLEKLLR